MQRTCPHRWNFGQGQPDAGSGCGLYRLSIKHEGHGNGTHTGIGTDDGGDVDVSHGELSGECRHLLGIPFCRRSVVGMQNNVFPDHPVVAFAPDVRHDLFHVGLLAEGFAQKGRISIAIHRDNRVEVHEIGKHALERRHTPSPDHVFQGFHTDQQAGIGDPSDGLLHDLFKIQPLVQSPVQFAARSNPAHRRRFLSQ
jgi:hypothetical protein